MMNEKEKEKTITKEEKDYVSKFEKNFDIIRGQGKSCQEAFLKALAITQ